MRKKELKAALFDSKLASFIAFPSLGDAFLLGELAFTDMQLPFNKLDISTNGLKSVDNRAHFGFLLLLEHGERIVAFELTEKDSTKVTCFDRLIRVSRQIHIESDHVHRRNVAQCGPSEFVVCHYRNSPELTVYDSDLHCLRNVRCKWFLTICCNSKFVFGIFETYDSYDSDEEGGDKQEEEYLIARIQVHHLDTLSEAFELRVPAKYKINHIIADEHRVVAMCSKSLPHQRYMSIFDLATCNESGCDNSRGEERARKFFMAERHIVLPLESLLIDEVFLLVFPNDKRNIFVWFNKNGEQSESSTEVDLGNMRAIYSFNSCLLFDLGYDKLLLKRI